MKDLDNVVGLEDVTTSATNLINLTNVEEETSKNAQVKMGQSS